MSDRVTDEAIAELQRLYEQSTPGVWATPMANLYILHSWDETHAPPIPTRCICEVADDAEYGNIHLSWPNGSREPAVNMRLIATMHKHLPAILTELVRLRAIEARLDAIYDAAKGGGR